MDKIKGDKLELRERLSCITGMQESEMPKVELLARLVELDKEIKVLKSRVNDSERAFSKAYVAFLSYKENADLIDGFEVTLNTLKQEKPRIIQSLAKISENFSTLKLLVDDILDNNVNYSP